MAVNVPIGIIVRLSVPLSSATPEIVVSLARRTVTWAPAAEYPWLSSACILALKILH